MPSRKQRILILQIILLLSVLVMASQTSGNDGCCNCLCGGA